MSEIDTATWEQARRTVAAAMRSSLACTIASVDADGRPHATPIGSVTLLPEPGRAVYFDVFNARLARNIEHDPRVCILAVDARKRVWLGALVRGRFNAPAGLQFDAVVGPRRPITDVELDRFHRDVGPLLRTRGGRAVWSDVRFARDVTIESVRPLRLGALTRAERAPAPTPAR